MHVLLWVVLALAHDLVITDAPAISSWAKRHASLKLREDKQLRQQLQVTALRGALQQQHACTATAVSSRSFVTNVCGTAAAPSSATSSMA